MTAVEPVDNTQPTGQVVSRQASTPAYVAPPQRPMSELEAMARMIAKAPPDMLPKAYVNNPGACLLATDYADRMDLSIFEVLAEVSFNRGRPSVGARLQKKMASRRGYRTQKIDGDERSCTVAVFGPDGNEVGRATYTMATAEALGIIYQKDGRTLKPTWSGDPAQMLFHRATTRALDHYGPSEYGGMFADPDVIEDDDPIAVAHQSADAVAELDQGELVEAEPQAEPLDDTQAAEADIRALAKANRVSVGAILKHAQETWPDAGLATIEAVAADPERAAAVKDWIRGG